MPSIFLYGSLLEKNLRDVVFADSLHNTRIETAIALGYSTLRYPQESFPVLLPRVGQSAKGILLIDPTAEALERMAFYEGDEYEIASLSVTLDTGEVIHAQYNRALELDGVVFEEPWCLHKWQATESQILVEITKQYFTRGWGIMDVTQADKLWRQLQYLRETPTAMSG